MKSTPAERLRDLIILPLLILCICWEWTLCRTITQLLCFHLTAFIIIHLGSLYSPEEKVKQMEKKVNELIEESCFANDRGEYPLVRETHPDIVYSGTDLRKTFAATCIFNSGTGVPGFVLHMMVCQILQSLSASYSLQAILNWNHRPLFSCHNCLDSSLKQSFSNTFSRWFPRFLILLEWCS